MVTFSIDKNFSKNFKKQFQSTSKKKAEFIGNLTDYLNTFYRQPLETMPHVKSSLLMTTVESELVRSLVLVSVQAYLSAHPPIMMPKISRVLYMNRFKAKWQKGAVHYIFGSPRFWTKKRLYLAPTICQTFWKNFAFLESSCVIFIRRYYCIYLNSFISVLY